MEPSRSPEGDVFEPWANLSFRACVTHIHSKTDPVPWSSLEHLRGLGAAWKDALSLPQALPRILPYRQQCVAQWQLSVKSKVKRDQSPISKLPPELLLSIAAFLSVREVLALRRASPNFRNFFRQEKNILGLQHTAKASSGPILALVLLSMLDATDPTKLTCCVCVTRHPVPAFAPVMLQRHTAERPCMSYLRDYACKSSLPQTQESQLATNKYSSVAMDMFTPSSRRPCPSDPYHSYGHMCKFGDCSQGVAEPALGGRELYRTVMGRLGYDTWYNKCLDRYQTRDVILLSVP